MLKLLNDQTIAVDSHFDWPSFFEGKGVVSVEVVTV